LWHSAAKGEKRLHVHADAAGVDERTLPKWEVIRFDFPAREQMPPVRMTWYNGSSGPKVRSTIEDLLGRKLDWGDAGEKKWNDFAGLLVIGTKGKIHANGHNTVFKILPDGLAEPDAPRTLPRSPGHEQEWLNACKGGPAGMSNFNYGGPLSEFVLLGNAATLNPGDLEFDCATGKFVGNSEANRALQREYRKGWTL